MSTAAAEQALVLDPAERGPALLALPENQWFDRKSSRISPRELADWLVDFANAEGGIIVLGLWGGKVEGVDLVHKRLPDWQQAALDFTVPAVASRPRLVECVNDGGHADHLLVIEVEPGEKVHSNRKDKVYLRVGDENRALPSRNGKNSCTTRAKPPSRARS